LRNIRKEKDIPHKEKLRLLVKDNDGQYPGYLTSVLQKLASISGIEFTGEKIDKAISFRIKTIEFYIPVEDKVDFQQEIASLTQELGYTRGFLESVMVKLNNENFVKNAPAVVIEKERKKKEDAENKIKLLEERLTSMKK
jgi:valyl-tRNA synthetase